MLQYEAIEGSCHLTFRTALVKLTGMKLSGIGFATALVAASGVAAVDGTRSCALSAAVRCGQLLLLPDLAGAPAGWKGGLPSRRCFGP